MKSEIWLHLKSIIYKQYSSPLNSFYDKNLRFKGIVVSWFYYKTSLELTTFLMPTDSIKLLSYYQKDLMIEDKRHYLSFQFFQCYFMIGSGEWGYGIFLNPNGIYIKDTNIDVKSGLCIILNDYISNYLLFSSLMSLILFYFTPTWTYSSMSWLIYIWIWMNQTMYCLSNYYIIIGI